MYGSLSSARLPPRGLSLSFPPPFPFSLVVKSAPTPISAGRGWRGLLRARWRARRRVGRAPVAVALGHLWKRRPPPSTTSEKLPTQASLTQHAPDWTATPATPRKSWTKSRDRSPSGPAASKQRPLPMEMHSRASQRSSRRPSSARIGRDRGMPKNDRVRAQREGLRCSSKSGYPTKFM